MPWRQKTGQERKEHEDRLCFIVDVGETSASSAALESIVTRRIAEYFMLLSA